MQSKERQKKKSPFIVGPRQAKKRLQSYRQGDKAEPRFDSNFPFHEKFWIFDTFRIPRIYLKYWHTKQLYKFQQIKFTTCGYV